MATAEAQRIGLALVDRTKHPFVDGTKKRFQPVGSMIAALSLLSSVTIATYEPANQPKPPGVVAQIKERVLGTRQKLNDPIMHEVASEYLRIQESYLERRQRMSLAESIDTALDVAQTSVNKYFPFVSTEYRRKMFLKLSAIALRVGTGNDLKEADVKSFGIKKENYKAFINAWSKDGVATVVYPPSLANETLKDIPGQEAHLGGEGLRHIAHAYSLAEELSFHDPENTRIIVDFGGKAYEVFTTLDPRNWPHPGQPRIDIGSGLLDYGSSSDIANNQLGVELFLAIQNALETGQDPKTVTKKLNDPVFNSITTTETALALLRK